ncbi:PucR family transcriptional regulator [Eubacterium ramulus]
MITLKTLLGQLQDTCHCTVRNDYDTTRFISRIDILRRDTVLCGDTLYLCPDEVLTALIKKEDDASKTNTELSDTESGNMDLKTDAFSEPDQTPALLIDAAIWETYTKESAADHFPAAGKLSHTADEKTAFALQDRFSVIPVENMPAPEDTFLLLNQRLTFELRLQQEINDLYHLLYSGHGLDDLILRAESFLHRPMSVLDASYSMIAVSPLMHKLPFGMEKSKEGSIFLSSQEVESLRRLQIEHQIYKNNQAFFIRTEDHPDTNWIFCGIRIQHVMTGYVALCLPDKAEASEHELRLITAFSDICAIEMQKHEFFVQKTGLQYETFLTELLEGRFNDVNIIEARLKLLNRRFGKFFCLAILYCPEPHNSDLFNKRQMASLRQVYPNAMSVVYKNNIILLINQDTPVQLSPELTDPLEQFAERNHLKVSLSQPFADILKIRIFYHQALHTLELSDLQAPDQTLFYSTDVLPEYLFSKCNYQELEVGIHYHIFQLQDYDKTYHTDFVETLRAYLDHDRNAAKTAEFLHIHRSTFFYRVKKIEELLEISISDSHLLFLYELSFKIWDYLCR